MATGVASTYTQSAGRPRSLMNIIFDISPIDTPFLTMAKKDSCTQTTHVWNTDALLAPGANAQLEGDDVTTYSYSAIVEQSNQTQISYKAIKASGTAIVATPNGVKNEYNYQLARRMKELKKDMEYALVGNTTASTGATNSARQLRGLMSWFSSSTNTNIPASNATLSTTTGSAAYTSTATVRAFTEDMLMGTATNSTGVIIGAYSNGGNPSVIMAAPKLRSKLNAFNGFPGATTSVTRFSDPGDRKIHATVDVYVSDYGSLKLVPNRVMAAYTAGAASPASAVFALDPEYWGVAFLREPFEEPLAKVGDSQRGMVLAEYTLVCRSSESKANGAVFDVF